jgi:hypothetical protein
MMQSIKDSRHLLCLGECPATCGDMAAGRRVYPQNVGLQDLTIILDAGSLETHRPSLT